MSSIFKKILKTFSNIKEKTIVKLNKLIKKINIKFSPKTFFKNSFIAEKSKAISIATAFVLIFAITIGFGSSSKMAVYIKGEKIGYAEDENAAISMVEQYNNFADTNHGTSSDIILQNEFTMERNLLSGNMVQEAISDVIDEEFKDKFKIDEIITAKKEEVEKMTSNISKTLKEEYEKAENKGEEKGILLMKKVLKLSKEGMSIEDIVKLCETTEEKVKKILE